MESREWRVVIGDWRLVNDYTVMGQVWGTSDPQPHDWGDEFFIRLDPTLTPVGT
jgi:hypothetical protein